LVLAVQNAVEYRLLGAATSGVTMLRGIGGSIGTAVLGTIFTSRLTGQLKATLHGPLGEQVSKGARLTGAQVARLPAGPRSLYQHAYVHALRPAFFMAAAAAVLGFALSLLLPERKLRGAPATSTGLEDGLAAPRAADSLAEIERSLTRVTTPEERMRFRERVAERAGLRVSPGATWALVRIREHGAERARSLAAEDGVPPERIAEVTLELRTLGLLTDPDGGLDSDGGSRQAALTPAGSDHAERLLSARRELLEEALADDTAVRDPQVLLLLRRLAVELCGEPPRTREPAATA
ncbi:MAG TPA: hypothetical protein VLZ06_04355, partial [Solirubrobacteraceae bacterium]|nr:hypothetical protein [Solirubrobacteraceae bacterium]